MRLLCMRLLRSSHAYCGKETPTSCTWRARALLRVPKVAMLFSSSPVLSVVIKSIRPCGVPALTRVSVRARHAQCVEKRRAHAVPYTVYYIRYAHERAILLWLARGANHQSIYNACVCLVLVKWRHKDRFDSSTRNQRGQHVLTV